MTRRAVVTVPAVSFILGEEFDPPASRRLTASFSLTDTPTEPVVQLAGTLRANVPSTETSHHFVRGFRSACEQRGRVMPAGLVVRATSQIPVEEHAGISAAAVVAGVAAANALLGLGLGDHDLGNLSVGVLQNGSGGTHSALRKLPQVIASHRVTVHHDCEDPSVP
jgi:homoserine kinase